MGASFSVYHEKQTNAQPHYYYYGPSRDFSILALCNITYLILQERLQFRNRLSKTDIGSDWLAKHKVKGFFSLIDGLKMEEAAKALMQTSGVGKLKPNVLLMGYKSDWQTCSFGALQTYFNILQYDNNTVL
jgi:hypothetical protein